MAGESKSEEQLKAVYFAAGVAAFMACVERAIVVSVFMHWHVWVFLVLNLLLLAILVTSKPNPPSRAFDQESGTTGFAGMKTSQESSPQVSTNDGEWVGGMKESSDSVKHETKKKAEDEVKKEDDDLPSKEELNQRAEAFIAMFRQHLVSDAKEEYQANHVFRTSTRLSLSQSITRVY